VNQIISVNIVELYFDIMNGTKQRAGMANKLYTQIVVKMEE